MARPTLAPKLDATHVRRSGADARFRSGRRWLTERSVAQTRFIPFVSNHRTEFMNRTPLRSTSRLALAAGLGMACLAGLAIFNRRRTRAAERHSPPAGRFVAVDGVRLHYLDRGAGAPIVLLHGNGAMAVDFAASGLIDRLSASFRVLAFDRPGFGYSARPRGRSWSPRQQARLIAAAVQQLGIARPIVVGHSWGALVALEWALARPQEVAALVLLSGYYFASFRKDVALAVPQATPMLGDIFNHTIAPVMARLAAPRILRKIFAPRGVPARFASGFPLDLALRPAQLRAAARETVLLLPAALALAARRQKEKLALPVAILAGGADEIVDTVEQSARLAEELDAPLTVIPGAGHMIHYDAPDRIAAAIEAAATAGAMIEPAAGLTADSFRAIDGPPSTRILPARESRRM
jgi:pimeloyl-ACP methyl ester carboxylesterase